MGALAGTRVVDLTVECSSFCGKLLADLGADVVKVEPREGDPGRKIGPFLDDRPGPERSLFFWYYNSNKRGVMLDATRDRDRHRLNELLDCADAVLVSGSPAELQRRGLGYAQLSENRPCLVVTVVSPFGLTGPRAEWRSSDMVAQALGGMVFVNGHPDEAPLRALGPQAHHAAGLHAAIGTVLALLARRRSGRGQLVDVSLQESVIAAVEHVTATFRASRQIETRRGTLHWTRMFRLAKCRDGFVLLSSLGDWTTLIEWIKADGRAGDLSDAAWEEFAHRRDNAEHLFEVVAEWAGLHSAEELLQGAALRRLPFAALGTVEALPTDLQLRARDFFVALHHNGVGRAFRQAGAPYRFSGTPCRIRRAAPRLGEHTDEVLQPARPHDRPAVAPSSGPNRDRQEADPSASGPGSGRVLEGIRVLDFTWVVAGPVATRVLADHGADVIKIEHLEAAVDGNRRSGLHGNLHRGKRSLGVNLADPRGVDLVRNLVRHSDVVIDNFSSRVMSNWGLDYAQLRALRPDVIALGMSGFGRTGPERDRVSYGPTLQALAGFTERMRHPDGEPAGWGFSYSDMVAGYSAALAVLSALRHREVSGVGQFIDLSQFEALASMVGTALQEALVHGQATTPLGNTPPAAPAAPHGIYRCRDLPGAGGATDRWCAIAVFGDIDWERFVAAIGSPAWTRQARFASCTGRLAAGRELDRLVQAWTRQRTAESVMNELQAAGVAAGIVANAVDLCERDPHLEERAYWIEVEDPEDGKVTLDGIVPLLSRNPGFVSAAAPLLGENADEVLREVLGMTDGHIERLRGGGVIV